jgi:glycosyltransferase involved in cell wall biosynthesis
VHLWAAEELSTDEQFGKRVAAWCAQVDHVHANSLAMSLRLGRIATELPVPCTGHVRDIMRLSSTKLGQLEQLQGLICVSQAVRNHLRGLGLTEPNLEVIYNGIDLHLFQPRPRTGWLRRELGLQDSVPLVLNVGQICLRKAQDVFAQVAVQVARELPLVHFAHCGVRHSGKTESIEFDRRLDQIFQEAGCSSRWHRLGERQSLELLYPEVDLLLHTARQEPLGRVLLEAAACGVPIIATDVGGTSEIVRDGFEGVLCPVNNGPALATAAIRLLKNQPQVAALATAARTRCSELFSVTAAAQRHWDFWMAHSR